MTNLNYGIIGNCRSAALVSDRGAIEWCCLPEFDSPSVFAKLLDSKKGGSFEFLTDDTYEISQKYIESTSILVTTFSNGVDVFEVNDFMPRYRKDNGGYQAPPEIIRYLRKLSGSPSFKVIYNPGLEYAAGQTINYVKDDYIVSLSDSEKFDSLFLYSNLHLDSIASGSNLTLNADGFILLAYNEKIFNPTLAKINLEFERTKTY